jgi:hypothetical protein
MNISDRARVCKCEAEYEFNYDVHIVRVFQWNDFDGNGDKRRTITCLFVGTEEYGRALAAKINEAA